MSAPPPPPPPSGSSLLARLGWAVKDRLFGRGDEERAFDAVKLVHAEDLRRWDRGFRGARTSTGSRTAQYRTEARRLELRRRSVADLISAGERLRDLDTDTVVEYRSEMVEVPRAGLLRRAVRLPLPQDPLPRDLGRELGGGTIAGRSLEVEAGWRLRYVRLTYRGPSRKCVNAKR